MEFLIITGLSGAGKTRVMDLCEDLDYYCVDNMPIALVRRFAELCLATRGRFERVALVLDVRAGADGRELTELLDELKGLDCGLRVLFIKAAPAVLIRRYKESRRPHPMGRPGGTIADAVRREQDFMAPMLDRADYILDTSSTSLSQLQNELYAILAPDKTYFSVHISSFGFKHGVPPESDLVFDVRCLPNPFYQELLKPLSGLDEAVAEYVFRFENSRILLDKLLDLLSFLLPRYMEEGRHVLNISVGCTGGRHRSVAVAKAIADALEQQGHSVTLSHRDMERSAP